MDRPVAQSEEQSPTLPGLCSTREVTARSPGPELEPVALELPGQPGVGGGEPFDEIGPELRQRGGRPPVPRVGQPVRDWGRRRGGRGM